jgi:hypothetical protein
MTNQGRGKDAGFLPACKTHTRFALFHRLDDWIPYEMLEPPEMAKVAETSFFRT